MKAAIVTGPGKLRIEEAPLPVPGTGEVRVRLEGCGVCSSNLGPWAGPEWMRFPTEPGGLGHEGWGIVDAVGAEVDEIGVGDRVAALFTHSYAEFDVGPAKNVVRLPQSLAGIPFPGEPFGCAMNIFRRSDICAGQTIAIIGIGFLGAILTRLASRAGAKVIAISRRPFSLAIAERMGASITIAIEDKSVVLDAVREITDGRFCERVIEATGKQYPLELAAELTGERGRLIIAGYHQDGPRQVNMQLWNWRGLDVVNAHERDPEIYVQGIRDAVNAIEASKIDPASLLTHTYPLERLDEALNATRDRPNGFLKAFVVMR